MGSIVQEIDKIKKNMFNFDDHMVDRNIGNAAALVDMKLGYKKELFELHAECQKRKNGFITDDGVVNGSNASIRQAQLELAMLNDDTFSRLELVEKSLNVLADVESFNRIFISLNAESEV